MKLRLVLLLVSLACVVVGSILVRRSFSTGPINRANFERIQEGMTLQDVCQLIGLPPGKYGAKFRTRVQVLPDEAESFWHRSDNKRYVYWVSDDSEIIVSVSPDERITGKMLYGLTGGTGETAIEMLRRWLGLQQRKAINIDIWVGPF